MCRAQLTSSRLRGKMLLNGIVPMDSQLTLVNPAPPTFLTFGTNSMINTTLFLDTRPAYTISTALQGSTTEIADAGSKEVLARIVRKEVLPDTVAFAGGKEIRVSKWLRKAKLPDGFSASEIDTEVGKCYLRMHREYRLALFTEYDLDTPVAHWERHSDPFAPPTLVLYSGTENFRPQIVAAFTIMELKMRMTEKADIVALSKAAAQSTTLG
ncbi:hypothetical protein B0H10DRAFT_1999209 [Mycena sp. CBHHK59/15]|nr:hypothetical protein B0H10DRAFT_1999209 [Mycena sp. CBHHK59/15]